MRPSAEVIFLNFLNTQSSTLRRVFAIGMPEAGGKRAHRERYQMFCCSLRSLCGLWLGSTGGVVHSHSPR